MYCIPLLLVTVKHPVKSVHIFPVSGFASPIAANTTLLFSYLLGDKYVSVSSANCTIFFDLVFFLVLSKCPKVFASGFGRCAEINFVLRPGDVAKFPFFNSLIKDDFTRLKHVVCKKTC